MVPRRPSFPLRIRLQIQTDSPPLPTTPVPHRLSWPSNQRAVRLVVPGSGTARSFPGGRRLRLRFQPYIRRSGLGHDDRLRPGVGRQNRNYRLPGRGNLGAPRPEVGWSRKLGDPVHQLELRSSELQAAASGRPTVLGFPGDAGGGLSPAPNPVMRAGLANSKPYLRLYAESLHRWPEIWLNSLYDDADPSMPPVDTYDQLGDS